jgi:ABC-type thiamine transport system substrate-binding protein
MSDLRTLSVTVQDLKRKLEQAQQVRWDAVVGADINEMERQIAILTNQLFDAVGDLHDFIKAETGISANQFYNNFHSSGYVSRGDVELPKRIQAHM